MVVVCVPPLYFAVIVTTVEAVTLAGSTMTLADFCPAGTTSVAGTANAVLLLVSATLAPPEGAAPLKVTVTKSPVEPNKALEGPAVTATDARLGNTTGVSVTVAVCVPPLYFAVTVTAVDAVTAEVCTFTFAVVRPAATTTLAGSVSAALPLESVTVAPPEGAAALSVTVSESVAPPVTLACAGAIETRFGSTTGVNVTVAVCVPPLYFAVTVTELDAVTAVDCTFTDALFCPAATTTVEGTGNAALLLASVTLAPPGGAAALSATVT